ncbi:hypothetical protein BK816_00375 [Boudabousia tangfeifanii]|uniref:Pentapeptide repeat protein n=2 Tax=Boudabousia tangfeifanii TaxID=1912795 RepID=A0A1D9MI14_9ACTO|nr:hypothetical protein BK816_00375 [Boudabousia tangfeifanii]
MGSGSDPKAVSTAAISTTGGLGGVIYLVQRYRDIQMKERMEKIELDKLPHLRYQEAVELLSSDNVLSRISAVLKLEYLANERLAADKNCPMPQQIVNILCAYLRNSSSFEIYAPITEFSRKRLKQLRKEKSAILNFDFEKWPDELSAECDQTVQQTIVQVIANNTRPRIINEAKTGGKDEKTGEGNGASVEEEKGKWSSLNFDLHETVFACPLHWENCVFEGKVEFWGAIFRRSVYFTNIVFNDVNFNGCTFFGRFIISNAKLVNATFQGKGKFIKWHPDIKGAENTKDFSAAISERVSNSDCKVNYDEDAVEKPLLYRDAKSIFKNFTDKQQQ